MSRLLNSGERLSKIKKALGVTGSYQDETLLLYIDEVIEEMVSAGVKEEVACGSAAIGCISVGVNDLWNYSSGEVKHSDYFYKRLIQLSLR